MTRHLITLSFDDGFRKSFTRTAEIYEASGLAACLNIFSMSCERAFKSPDEYHNVSTGTWELWNELAARGHEIMPNGYDHSNHARIPLEESRKKIDLCLEAFNKNMKGFNQAEAVFNFPYNSSTPEVEAYLVGKVRGIRTGGSTENPWPAKELVRLGNAAFGPGNCEAHLDRHLERFLAGPEGWFVYNLHGLNDEGWGPIGEDYLRRLLERLLKIEGVEMLPAAAALKKYG